MTIVRDPARRRPSAGRAGDLLRGDFVDGRAYIDPAVFEAELSAAAVERAAALVSAFEEQADAGRSAFRFEGTMVDAPHLARARRLLDRAGAADPNRADPPG